MQFISSVYVSVTLSSAVAHTGLTKCWKMLIILILIVIKIYNILCKSFYIPEMVFRSMSEGLCKSEVRECQEKLIIL